MTTAWWVGVSGRERRGVPVRGVAVSLVGDDNVMTTCPDPEETRPGTQPGGALSHADVLTGNDADMYTTNGGQQPTLGTRTTRLT